MTVYNDEETANFREYVEALKVAVDPRYLLESLGFYISNENYAELRGACKVHGGDNKTGFRFNKDTRTWTCFTRGCHETYGYDIIGLIEAINGVNFSGALAYLKDLVGDITDLNSNYHRFKQKNIDDRFIRDYNNFMRKPPFVNEESLEQFKYLRSGRFIKDGFSRKTLDHFEIAGGHTDKDGIVRDIIPIRNSYGDLVGYSLRDIRDFIDEDFSKYILTPGFDKDSVLYNLHTIRDTCYQKPLIIVEGFKSVWRLYEYGIKNVVAIMGSRVTEGQLTLIKTHAFAGVVLFLDNDVAGHEGTLKAYEHLKSEVKPIRPVYITEVDDNGKGLDPSDLSKEQVYSYLRTYY